MTIITNSQIHGTSSRIASYTPSRKYPRVWLLGSSRRGMMAVWPLRSGVTSRTGGHAIICCAPTYASCIFRENRLSLTLRVTARQSASSMSRPRIIRASARRLIIATRLLSRDRAVSAATGTRWSSAAHVARRGIPRGGRRLSQRVRGPSLVPLRWDAG